MDRQKEKQLAAELKNGSTAALGEMIDGLSGYVCTVVRNFSRGVLSEDDIDEISSDIFFKLWQNREKLDENIGLKPYLSVSAKNAVKNRFRDTRFELEDISEFEISDNYSIEDQAEINEIMRCLGEGLDALPERDREIFSRYYFFGELTPDIAKIIGISEGSVRSVLSRTRSKLKDYLVKRGFENYV